MQLVSFSFVPANFFKVSYLFTCHCKCSNNLLLHTKPLSLIPWMDGMPSQKAFQKLYVPFIKHVYIYNKSHCDGLVHQFRALARQFLTLSSLGQGYHGHLFTVASMMGISKEAEFAPSGKLKKFLLVLLIF